MCGISAACLIKNPTVEQRQLALMKIKLLGVYSQERGEHGCGIYINKEIYKGYNDINEKDTPDTTKFTNFLKNPKLLLPQIEGESPIVMQHARSATIGARTKENNHPFIIESVKGEENNLTIMHNGTIQNIEDLCKKYGVEYEIGAVDSYLLGKLIDKVGYKVLEEYKGYATLLWNKVNEPNALYVYHGASREEEKGVLFIERPLFYMKTPEGIYFSSAESYLHAIQENEQQKIVELECNNVRKVVDGKFTNYKKFIDREKTNIDINKKVAYNWPDYSKNNSTYNYNNSSTLYDQKLTPKKSSIFEETLPPKIKPNKVYFHLGRYFKAEGEFCHGIMFLDKKGFIHDPRQINATPYYFWDGVMIKAKSNYEWLEKTYKELWGVKWLKDKQSSNFALDMSTYSMYPLTSFPPESKIMIDFYSFGWYHSFKRVDKQNFTPLFSSRTYFIENGYLVRITGSIKGDKPFDEPNVEKANNQLIIFNGEKKEDVKEEPEIYPEGWIFEQKIEREDNFYYAATEIEENALKAVFYDEFENEYLDAFELAEKVMEAMDVLLKLCIKEKITIEEALGDGMCASLYYHLEILKGEAEESEEDGLVDDGKIIDIPDDMIEITEKDSSKIDVIMEDVTDFLSELNVEAGNLEILTNIPIAQELSDTIFKGIASIKSNLIDISIEHGKKLIVENLNKKLTII